MTPYSVQFGDRLAIKGAPSSAPSRFCMLDAVTISMRWMNSSCRGRLQSRHSQKVVSGADQVGGHLRFGLPDEACLSQSTYGLHPAEDLLDAFALSLADGVAAVPGSACIEARCDALVRIPAQSCH